MRNEALRVAVAKAFRGNGSKFTWDEITAPRRRFWLEMADTALEAIEAHKREHSLIRRLFGVRRKP